VDERGQQIGPYRLDERLGEGGQSVVWKATDTRSGAVVALKKMRDLRGQLQHIGRLRREAGLLLSFSDPGLPRGIELLEGPDGPEALVLEFIDGQPLHRLLQGPLSASLLWPLFLELTRLVALLHERGVAHRDLKQPNILVRPGWENGVPGSVVLVDFGIARGNNLFATAYTNTGATLGTCAFMAPELLSGLQEPTAAHFLVGDVFALAVVFWSLLTGRLPCGLPMNASLMHLVGLYSRGVTFAPEPAQVEAIERAVPGLVRVLERCLAYNPAHRFRDAGELRAALLDLEQGVRVDSLPRGPSPQAHTYLADLPTSALVSTERSASPPSAAPTDPTPPVFSGRGSSPSWEPSAALSPAAPGSAPAPVLAPAPRPALSSVPDDAPGSAPVLTPSPGSLPAVSPPAAPLVPAPLALPPSSRAGRRKGSFPWFAVGLILGLGVVFVVGLVGVALWKTSQVASATPPGPTATGLPTAPVRSLPTAPRAARFATVAPPSGNNNGVVRAGPGLQHAEVEQLPRGTLVRVLDPDNGNGWYRIQSARGAGFMHRDVLKFP
jgi:serine/threonine-protein kinase